MVVEPQGVVDVSVGRCFSEQKSAEDNVRLLVPKGSRVVASKVVSTSSSHDYANSDSFTCRGRHAPRPHQHLSQS